MAVCENKETGGWERPTQGSFLRQNRLRPLKSSKFLSFHEGIAAAIRIASGKEWDAFAFVHKASKFRQFLEECNDMVGALSLFIADCVPCKGKAFL